MAAIRSQSPDDILQDRLLLEVPLREGFKVLGPVVLYRRLGRGGMGSVYLGRHLRLECEVAVKCLGQDLADDEEFVKRFRAEARSAAHLHHQNIVHVYDVDEASRLHFLVMEYVDGETAGDRLKRKGPLPEHEAIAITLGAAHGLAHAHAKGFVHRDIKPDNILISREGAVKVADLGLAKPVGDTGRSMATRTGIGFGTPAYMPPEQARSAKDVGFSADVYSLAAMLYSLLTGDKPFAGSDVFEVLQQVVNDPFPDVLAKRPDVSKELAALIERSTRKDPAERPVDAREFAQALSAVAHGADVPLADDSSGELGETRPLVSPPPREVLTRIEVSLRDGDRTVAGATEPGSGPGPAPSSPSLPPERSFWARLGPIPLLAAGGVLVAAAAFAARWSGDPGPPTTDPAIVELRLVTVGAEQVLAAFESAQDTFRGLRTTLESDGRDAEAATYRSQILPAVNRTILDSEAVQKAVVRVKFTRELVEAGSGDDARQALADLPQARVALQEATRGLEHAGALVGDLRKARSAEESARRAVSSFEGWEALGGSEARALGAVRPAADALEQALQAGAFGDARTAARTAASAWSALEAAVGRLAPAREAHARWAAEREKLAVGGRTVARPAELEAPLAAAWKRADDGELDAFVDAHLAVGRTLDRRTAAAQELLARETGWSMSKARWDEAVAQARDEAQRAQMEERRDVVAAAEAARERAWADALGGALEPLIGAAARLEQASSQLRTALGDVDLDAPTLLRATPAAGSFPLEAAPTVELVFDEPLASATLDGVAMELSEDRRTARLVPAREPRDRLSWTATDAAGNRAADELPIALVTVSAPAWADVLEAKPDPAVVTDPDGRRRILETGLAWKVRDRESGVVLLLVPPGSYRRGASPGDSDSDPDEQHVHEVRIAQPFYMGQFELTQAEWQRLSVSNPSNFKGDDRPVERVPFNVVNGVLSRVGLRLPRESEWEYAARAGNEQARYGPLDEIAWHAGNSGKQTHPVGQKRANAWGFHDMLGNVSEWCSTQYDDGYYKDVAAMTPPVDSTFDDGAKGRMGRRSIRGGSWMNDASFGRVSNRLGLSPSASSNGNGLRVVRDP